MSSREQFPFDIDGAVVKLDELLGDGVTEKDLAGLRSGGELPGLGRDGAAAAHP